MYIRSSKLFKGLKDLENDRDRIVDPFLNLDRDRDPRSYFQQ